MRPRTLFGIRHHSQLLWKWHRRFRLQGRKPRPGAGMRRRAEQQGPRTHPPDGSRTRSSPPSLLSGWNRWHVASIYGNSRWRGDSENCSAWHVQVLQSGNAFCGAAPTLYQAPIPGGDYPSEVTHSPWPQRFQSSREILRFGVTNYQRSKKAYFPWAWLLLRSYLPSLLVAGRALTGTLAKERCLLAIGVPSSATAAGRKPSSFWAAVPGPPGSEDVHRGCDSW